MQPKIIVNGDSYPLDEAKTLLENLEKHGIAAEYQCREGFCGACRVKKISGDIEYIQAPIAFLRDNEILPCHCKARSDINISL